MAGGEVQGGHSGARWTLVDSLGTEVDTPRHVSGDTTRIIVSHVRAKRGEDAVARMLAAAGDRRSAQELEQDTCWSSYEQARALFDAAVEVLDDAHTFRDLSAVHEANLRRADRVGGETAGVFQTLGSPGEIFEHIHVALRARREDGRGRGHRQLRGRRGHGK